MPQHALYIDFEFCSGCHSCEIACRNELELPLEEWGMKVLEDRDLYGIVSEACDKCIKRAYELG